MIRKFFRKYLLQILMSDTEIRRIVRQIVLTNIGNDDGPKAS